MKLAIVTAYPPSKVTLNEYAFHLVNAFAKAEQITEIILLTDTVDKRPKLEDTIDGCKVTIQECWTFNSYNNLKTVSSAVKTSKADVVLFNLQFMKFGDKKIPAALGLMLPLVCRLQGTPSMVLLHNIMEEVDLNSAGFDSGTMMNKVYQFIGKSLTRFILKANKVAVTINKYQEVLRHNYNAQNVVTIPHGTFELPSERPDYSSGSEKLQVMAFGKFGTYKKVESMIEAVQIVKQRTGLDIETVIAGTDNPNVKGYLKDVEQEYSHVEGLRFTGYVAEEDVPQIFRESTVVCFPYSSTTGSSGVLHQAGSYGKAVAMPDLGDLARLVTDEGYMGEFFQPENVLSLADSLQNLLTDKSYRMKIAEQNYRAATAYPMSRICDMYIQNFNSIISHKASIISLITA